MTGSLTTDDPNKADMRARAPITVIFPVLNEEANLPAALESVAWADEIIVVDSGSVDRTPQIASEHRARVVQFKYDGSGPKKKAWALKTLSLHNEWVLLLDGDERITPDLQAEIEQAITSSGISGFYIDREFIFMNRSLRCFRPNWNMRLFMIDKGEIETLELHDVPQTGDNEIHEHVQTEGKTAFLKSPMLHEDYRGIGPWIERHNKYAIWEAHLYRKFRSEPIGVGPVGFVRLDAFKRKRILRRIWVRLPGRPALRFFTWYVLRRGFLDGRVGFTFCVLMSWYELLINIKLSELETEG